MAVAAAEWIGRKHWLFAVSIFCFLSRFPTLTGSERRGTSTSCCTGQWRRFAYEGDFVIPIRRVLKARRTRSRAVTALALYAGYYIKWVTRLAAVQTGEVSIDVGTLPQTVSNQQSLDLVGGAFALPVRRLSPELEQLITVVNSTQRTCGEYVNWPKYTIKSSFDRVVPGTYFGELETQSGPTVF